MLPVMIADRGAGQRPRSIKSLAGRRLEYVRLDDAVVLNFAGGHQVLIETPAEVNGPAGRVVVEPGRHSADILATLLGDVVRDARTSPGGELTITFGSGAVLLVCADDDFESWAVAGADGLVVCLAGGEVAVWGDASPSLRLA